VTRSALIVGAGIGGLSAAIALRNRRWSVQVFEQAPSVRELGFGLALAPNAMAALEDLGVAEVVKARSHEPRRGDFRRPDGTIIKRLEMPANTIGGPIRVALRQALHGALMEELGPDAIQVGRRVTGFAEHGDRVSVRFDDGTAIEGDVLIGADGSGSAIRRQLHPNEGPPRDSGITAVRGGVYGALQHLGDREAVYYLGPGIESVFVRASDTGMYWFLSLSRTLVPPGATDPRAVIAALSPRFDDTFRAVTAATDDLRLDDLYDRDPLPRWGTGRVTLLGDAAHPMLPQTGQGAAQAMVDAVRLAAALEPGVHVETALRAYERERMPKTAALVAQGRRTALLMGMTNPVASFLREMVLRAIPATTFARFFVKINRRAGTDVRRT
jgi:2-polyprenyl-6-methoxyphenol hydroxylase-like FAD-dependent oxidoreductase